MTLEISLRNEHRTAAIEIAGVGEEDYPAVVERFTALGKELADFVASKAKASKSECETDNEA